MGISGKYIWGVDYTDTGTNLAVVKLEIERE